MLLSAVAHPLATKHAVRGRTHDSTSIAMHLNATGAPAGRDHASAQDRALVSHAVLKGVTLLAFRADAASASLETHINASMGHCRRNSVGLNVAARVCWLAVSRIVVSPLSIDVVKTRVASSWSSTRDALFGWGGENAYL